MDLTSLKEKLREKKDLKEKLESGYKQVIGQIALLEEMISEEEIYFN